MNFEGELLANVGYEIPYSGWSWQMVFWREQLVPADFGYIYYSNHTNVPPAPDLAKDDRYVGGSAAFLDKDFNILRIRNFRHPGNPNNPCPFDDVSIRRSKHNTTYIATRSNRHYEQTEDDCYLYEFDDDIEGTQEVVPVLHDIHRGVPDFDFVAECRAVDVAEDGSVYFCYSLNVGLSLANDSWVVIEKFDEDMNTISEVYYGTRDDMIWYCAESITLTRDGGVLMTTHMKELTNQSHQGSVVVKFPAEAFLGIEEAHDNGLKVAVAYPNPGKDVLNIRTGLRNARVEVYDINGRIIHSQALTENVTAIDAGDWVEGVYVWKVMVDGKMVETGEWVKE